VTKATKVDLIYGKMLDKMYNEDLRIATTHPASMELLFVFLPYDVSTSFQA
jgi:hypothetical protein